MFFVNYLFSNHSVVSTPRWELSHDLGVGFNSILFFDYMDLALIILKGCHRLKRIRIKFIKILAFRLYLLC